MNIISKIRNKYKDVTIERFDNPLRYPEFDSEQYRIIFKNNIILSLVKQLSFMEDCDLWEVGIMDVVEDSAKLRAPLSNIYSDVTDKTIIKMADDVIDLKEKEEVVFDFIRPDGEDDNKIKMAVDNFLDSMFPPDKIEIN